jgi:hypothetical protein
MMPTPWEAAVKNTKQLTVFAAGGLLAAPAWGASLFKRILDEFNRLSSLHKLGVTLVESKTLPDPEGNSGVGANVQVEVSSGTHTFTFKTGPKPTDLVHTGSLPGTGIDLAGATHTITQGGEHIRAFVFLPLGPTIAGPGSRGVGPGVKVAISLHELIHACGLADSEHSPGTDPDLFMTGGSLSASFPPDKDVIDLGRKKTAPPIFITTRTARLIRDNWT